MRNKRWAFALLALLIALSAQPVCSHAAPDTAQTDVTATVESRFEFTLPPDAILRYPNTTVLVGQFTINDIFVESNERLAIELVPGAMRARGTGTLLPYTVTFNPPATVDAANIGEAYDVVVTLDAAAFAATRRPFHDADLVFRVRSLLTGDIVWQGTTTVTARKTPPNQGGGGGVDDGGGDDSGGVVVPPDTGDDTLPDEPVPQASPGIEGPQGGQPGVVIPPEEIPAAAWSGWWWWWIPVTALVLLLLLLILLLVLWRRRRREEEQSG